MDTDCCDNLDSNAMRTSKSQIFAAVLISGTLCPTVAMAWGAGGGGGVNIPGFGALWHEPNPPEFRQGVKKGWNGGAVSRGLSKGKKKSWRGGTVPSNHDR